MKNYEEKSNLYAILHQKETWLNRRTIHIKKLDAITQLGVIGDSRDILVLVKFLNHDSREIRRSTINSIEILFEKLDSKSTYETILRHCTIHKNDIRKYIKNYSGKQLQYPLAIASINSNGYIREDALNHILENDLSESLIQFIIYRLGDWVPEVRIAAERNFNHVLTTGKWESILNHLDLIFWLKKVQRVDLSIIYNKTIEYLLIDNSNETYSKFRELSESIRFNLCKEILKLDTVSEISQNTFINDKSYLVRSKIAENLRKTKNPSQLIPILQNDKSALVRQKCLLSRSKISSESGKINFKEFLFDKSATIRNIARFHLKDSNVNFLEIYKKGLEDNSLLVSSIYSIGEFGSEEEVDLILPYYNSQNGNIKKAAIRTILKLDATRIQSQLLDELNSKLKSVRKLAIENLSISPNDTVVNRCREIYSSGDVELKLSMLTFFGRVCSYKTLPDLINALDDSNENVVNSAWLHLTNWRKNSISNYTIQDEKDKIRAQEIYGQIKFRAELSFANKKLWNEIPYFGRFNKE